LEHIYISLIVLRHSTVDPKKYPFDAIVFRKHTQTHFAIEHHKKNQKEEKNPLTMDKN
jgi:hypothetical protein